MYFWNVLFVLTLLHVPAHLQGPECTANDLQYRYTECDAEQSRWRVTVPKPNTHCTITHPTPPIEGPKCGQSCATGQYLDVAGDQRCKSCPAGTYSVGNGVRFDRWDGIPEQFSTSMDGGLALRPGINCTGKQQQTWRARGDFIEGVANVCPASLVLTVELLTEGDLKVQYTNTYQGVLAMFQVKNLCQQSANSNGKKKGDGMKIFTPTKGHATTTSTIKMSPGQNKIMFSLMGLSTATPGTMFAIESIEVTGMLFTSSCTACKAGYYSSEGASHCTRCPVDTYSATDSSSSCLPCAPTHFAPPGSEECKPRPPCTASDYFKSIAPCRNGTTQITFDWLTPQSCNPNHTESVALPSPGDQVDCPPCNPGQALNQSTGSCEYCEAGFSSNGSGQCKQCPLHTVAKKSLVFNRFDTMPERFFTSCIDTSGEGSFCDKQHTWVPRQSYIQVSNDVPDDVFAVLNINVSQFANTTVDGRIFGTLAVRFEMNCQKDDPCFLYLMEESRDVHVLHSWNESRSLSPFSYDFLTPDIQLVSLAFRKSFHKKATPSKNTIKVYHISLSNTRVGGAAECTGCLLGRSESGCHSCPVGQVIVTNSTTKQTSCSKCPSNHRKVDSFNCTACGEGLKVSQDFTECLSDCHYSAVGGLKFDFSAISGLQTLNGSNMFTADGDKYHHAFNMVLCTASGAQTTAKATCVNNATDFYYWDGSQQVTSLVCRETVLPADNSVSIQPTSLGDVLTAISINDMVLRTKLKVSGGAIIDDGELTIHYKYASTQSTEHCPHGLTTTTTLICDTRESNAGTKSLPPHCISGTCDGCSYDVLWRTVAACPICSEDDYDQILGECVGGTQSIHYLPHKYCPMTDEMRAKKTSQPCTMLTLEIKIVIGAAAGVALLLLICAIYCWKRSKKLEYKYMRLVEGAQGNTGELPAAQTCAWSDEEEEEGDRVAFKTKGDQLFGKLGNSGKGDGFEKMKLVGSNLPEI